MANSRIPGNKKTIPGMDSLPLRRSGMARVLKGSHSFTCTPTDLYKYFPDAVPPIHAISYHVVTDKPSAQNGDKFRSIFSDNLQPVATRGKKARGTLLVDKHCSNGCSIKCAPLSVSYYNKISGGHIGRAVVRRRCSAGPVLPLCAHPTYIH